MFNLYFLERIIGVSVYVLITIIMFIVIYNTENIKLKKFLIIYLLFIVFLAFIYVPTTSADLYRYLKSAKMYSSLSYSELIYLIRESKAPIQIVYFYLLGKTGVDGLIPAVSALIFYGCLFKIVYKASVRYNLNNKSVALSLLFFMCLGGFLSVINIIRCFVAFSIIALCCYDELIEEKSYVKHIPLYLFASLMHPAAMALSIFRVMTILIKKDKNFFKKILNFFIVLFILFFMIKYGNEYLNLIFEKSTTYITGDIYSYSWEYIISLVYIFFSTYVLLKSRKMFKNNIEINNFNNFLLLINFVTLIFGFEYSIFTRLQLFSSMLFVPMFSIFIDVTRKNKIIIKNINYIFLITLVIVFSIACTRGNLCGYKFFIIN